MTRQKRKRPLKSVKLDELAHQRLGDLRRALGQQALPSYVEDMEILSALVLFTTPEQLAGMLQAYWRSTGRLLTQADDARGYVGDG